MSRFEKPETVRRADSVIKGQGSNLIDDPEMKKPEPKPEQKKAKPKAVIPIEETIKHKKKRKGGKRYANKT
ncbi:hypothetical protein LCGC14_0667280 [marine sediment metagenome]|uniref:Uncharacterized protein n=1 Tax=marine sediment metagenome TaxID=412755 RepID=A0A0F9U024_9ZZZZ